MAADFVLYLRSCGKEFDLKWWPETLMFASFHSTTMEIFARAKSKAYFLKIAPMLGVSSKDEFKALLDALDKQQIPRWEFETINPSALARVDELATTP